MLTKWKNRLSIGARCQLNSKLKSKNFKRGLVAGTKLLKDTRRRIESMTWTGRKKRCKQLLTNQRHKTNYLMKKGLITCRNLKRKGFTLGTWKRMWSFSIVVSKNTKISCIRESTRNMHLIQRCVISSILSYTPQKLERSRLSDSPPTLTQGWSSAGNARMLCSLRWELRSWRSYLSIL